MDSITLIGNNPLTTNNSKSSTKPICVTTSLLNLLAIEKKQNITIGDTCAFFLLASWSSEDLGAMVVASSIKNLIK